MRSLIQIIIISFFFFACEKESKPLFKWSFNQEVENIVIESNSDKIYSIISNFETPEFIHAFNGYGLRTDGYSTFVEGELPSLLKSSFTVSLWSALETYSTENAGFYSLVNNNSDTEEWISVGVNKFGKPVVNLKYKGRESTYISESIIPKFEWINVILTVENNEISLFINGKKVIEEAVDGIDQVEFNHFTIAKSYNEKMLHNLFPVSHINGIVDEFEIWDSKININSVYMEDLDIQNPDLSIPESRFAKDFNRPKYHMLPAANWTNESHGLIYYKNKYHIFNQKNGTNLFLGQINWGHFSSPDLIQWTEHKPVLSPEKGYDQIGIWSGHAIIDDNGSPVIMYTGGNGEEFGMCLASPVDEDLIEWSKFKNNPVVVGPPKNYVRKDFRDPYIWKDHDYWYMMVGFGLVEDEIEKGALLLYKSKDLKNWTYLHPLYKSEPEFFDSGVFWEMSVFWKMGNKYVLIANPIPYKGKPAIALYWVGDFINEKFVPDNKVPRKLEIINRLLSPSVALDKDGNTTALAIIPDLVSAEQQLKQGWTHLFSIPRIWDLKNGEIYQTPHPAMKKLRDSLFEIKQQKLLPFQNIKITEGHQVEVIVEINPKKSSKFGFIIGKNEANKEGTKIYLDFAKNELVVDQTNASQNELIEKRLEKGDITVNINEVLKIQLFIDGSVVEGFINDKSAFTTRIFPKFKNSNQLELFTEGSSVDVKVLKYWKLKSSDNITDF